MSKDIRTGWIHLQSHASETDHVKMEFSQDHPETHAHEHEPGSGEPDDRMSAAFLFADKASEIHEAARIQLKSRRDKSSEDLFNCTMDEVQEAIFMAGKELGQKPVACLDHQASTSLQDDHTCALKSAKIAARHGDADAQFFLAACFAEGDGVAQDHQEAARWYRKAAERGHADAQDNLGVCFDHGKGVDQNHIEAALWFKEAAKQGLASAQLNLGSCYYEGRGVRQSMKKCVHWWLKAAEQGYSQAQLNLGLCCTKGNGIKQDDAKAMEWYGKAAEQGSRKAQAILAKAHLEGTGVPADPGKAKHWIEKAIAAGFEDNENLLEKISTERARGFQKAATDSKRLSMKPSLEEIMAITDALDEAYPDWENDNDDNYQLIENLYDNFEHLR
ncbi:MAG: tetratricopeptide repeat protein [Akkermansiaceae bacterium]